MHMREKIARMMVAAMLCAFLAAMALSPAALAQSRGGGSGLPSGPGNPMADLQQQIDALTQRIAALAQLGQDVGTLRQQVAALQQQMTALSGLQQQISSLQQQMTALMSLQQQVSSLQDQVTALGGLQQQLTTLSAQVAGLSAQMTVFASQLALLGSSGTLGVFDADSQRMGDVIGVQDNVPWVRMAAAGQTFVLQVLPGQLIGQFLWFSGPGCTGTVYIAGGTLTNGPNVFSIAAVLEPGGTVYAANAQAPVERHNVQSVRGHDGVCSSFSTAFGQNVVPATPVMTLDPLFTRPYSVHSRGRSVTSRRAPDDPRRSPRRAAAGSMG